MSRTTLIIFLCLTFVATACGGSVSDRTPTPSVTAPLPTARPTITPPATPTLAPATMPAPKEATPSPTPVTYKVQEGDTPILIANKFGVSVADLIALNNIDPATMQIGQDLIIPTGPQAAQPSDALLPSPTPGAFNVRGLNVYRTPVGSLECLGEVYNPGPNALGNVQLQIALLDQADQILLAAPVFVPMEVIPAEQSAPFRLLFTDPPAAYAKFSITPLRGEAVDPASRFAQLQVTRSEGAPSGSQYRVYGEISNADQVNASKIRLTVTTYDSEQRVIGYRDAVLSEGPLAPGATLPFDITLASSSPNVARFAVVVEALKS
ncbi:MAG: LysM peptidoglycan-binding domain-containing protein [Chloroflexi bacterium]|nr:LysM peptidoglycan-binding domain-containing protein [Chloroflexota bacterium]